MELGRARDMERKRAGARLEGVMEKRFEAQAAPSGALLVSGGIVSATMELSGGARPRIPVRTGERGSLDTATTAAVFA